MGEVYKLYYLGHIIESILIPRETIFELEFPAFHRWLAVPPSSEIKKVPNF